MRHEFENVSNLQWAELGLPYESARSDFKCKLCGKTFSHYYHREPSIYKALEQAGLKMDNCEGKAKDTLEAVDD